MKTIYTLAIFFFALVFASCKKETISHAADYGSSYRSWLTFKDSSNNSYRYMVTTVSWTGDRTETIITVREGKVVGRGFVYKRISHNGTTAVTTILQEWTEPESQLSTHKNGADPITLDKIYEQAQQDWLQKRDNARIYFEARNNGMISSCGYVPDGCQDDCFHGIMISFIEAI